MVGSVAYAATKAALDAFTITFADEVGKYGITVYAVDPGPTDTGWMTQEKQRELLSRHPLGTIGSTGSKKTKSRCAAVGPAPTPCCWRGGYFFRIGDS